MARLVRDYVNVIKIPSTIFNAFGRNLFDFYHDMIELILIG